MLTEHQLEQLERHERQMDRQERREERREERQERREEQREERHEDRLDDHRGIDYPTFHPGRSGQRILISLGKGAGWITYAPRTASDQFLVWMLTYEPLIRALERHERKERLEELLHDFHREARVKFNVERIACARVGDLSVVEVNGPFEVHECDGAGWVVGMVGIVGVRRIVPMGAVVY